MQKCFFVLFLILMFLIIGCAFIFMNKFTLKQLLLTMQLNEYVVICDAFNSLDVIFRGNVRGALHECSDYFVNYIDIVQNVRYIGFGIGVTVD